MIKYGDIMRYIGVFIVKDIRLFLMLENSGFINMNCVLDLMYDMLGELYFLEMGI